MRHGVDDLRELVHQRRPLPGAVLSRHEGPPLLAPRVRAVRPATPIVIGDTLSRPRHAGRGGRRGSARASTASSWPGCSTLRPHPERRQDPAGRRRRRRRRAAAGRVRRVQHGGRRPRARWPRSAPSMPDGMEIERRKMRGEWSNGMLCSRRELGLGDDHAGILILPAGLDPGTPLADALGHRARRALRPRDQPEPARRHVGRRRRPRPRRPASACRSRLPTPGRRRPAAPPAASSPRSRSIDPTGAAGSTPWVLRDVTVGPSPDWMRSRLTRLGMRPINTSSTSPTT